MRLAARFNGPPDSGHGGVGCGVFAGAVDGRAASVRLLSPPPLETEFKSRVSHKDVIVAIGGQNVERVRALPEGFEVMALPPRRLRNWMRHIETGSSTLSNGMPFRRASVAVPAARIAMAWSCSRVTSTV